MIGQYFYNQSTRNVVVAFGTLFNTIQLHKKDGSGNIVQSMKVPLAYGPKQKFLTRLDQDPSLSAATAITLPRLGFEIGSLSYDTARKMNRVQKFKKVKSNNKNKLDTQFMPVPYNLDITLFAMAKNSDDALQIVEQILPYFQPSFNLTIDLVKAIGEKRDIPIILDSMNFQDDYEGDFATRRALIYTLGFTAKTYLFGPVPSSSEGIIKKVQVDVTTNTDTRTAKREMRYTVEPDPLSAGPDDDFGFSETTSFFSDGKSYSPTQRKDI